MKKEKIVFLLITMLVMIIINVIATSVISNTLYKNEDNTKNVKGSTNELYGHSASYTSMDTRLSSIESHLINDPKFEFNSSWLDFYTGGKNRTGIGVSDDGVAHIRAKNENEENGKGTLNLRGNPVKFNGYTVKNILGVQDTTTTASASVNNKASTSTSGTITSVSGASDYVIIPYACDYGFPTGITRSGTTVTINVINSSGSAHSIKCNLYVIAYN